VKSVVKAISLYFAAILVGILFVKMDSFPTQDAFEVAQIVIFRFHRGFHPVAADCSNYLGICDYFQF
jgi:hypothetical protein